MWGYRVNYIGSARLSKHAASGLFFGVVAALGFLSAAALAGPLVPFSASGPMLTIDSGDVTPAGESGRFIVRGRHVTGTFVGSIGGTAGVPFVLTYDSNVPIATQSGSVHARLIAGLYEANVVLSSTIGLTPVPCNAPDGTTCIATPAGNFVPGLLLNGKMNFLSGAEGTGIVTGWLIPTVDAQGHITSIIASLITLSGQWIPGGS